MKLLDYEQVNGDQDKAKDLDERDPHSARHRHRKLKLRLPNAFGNGYTASHMHGSHITGRDGKGSYAEGRLSNETAVHAPGEPTGASDLSVPPGEKLTAPEQVV